MAGMFFSFDGIDGVGKSTQMRLFREWLEQRGNAVTVCRDPGGTPLGEAIRGLLLDRIDLAMQPRAEMLLYMAARAQLVDEFIRPAIEQGQVVVSDRFLLANIVYQGYAGGVAVDAVRAVGQIAVDGVQPRRVFLLDMDVDLALSRIQRPPDRMEARGRDFMRRVRDGFLREAALHPEQIKVIDASRDIESVQADIRQHAASCWS
jgi:dTMP kinase